MSLLNQLFNRGLLGAKCKTCLNLAISRIKLLQNKRDMQMKHMRKEIAQFLQAGQEAIARIRVEHVIREENIWAAYEILELFCEFILARVPILENQRECPSELREAVASIIFAAPRCSDVPDLLHVRNLFAAKYGKEFIAAASELRPDTSVNRTIVEKLSVSAPSAEVRLKLLKDIAQEHNVEWDYSKTEAELRKNPEDLLNGPKQVHRVAELPKAPSRKEPLEQYSPPVEAHRNNRGLQHSVPPNITHSYGQDIAKSISTKDDAIRVRESPETRPQTSDMLERAQAAIAAANRATAAARAAALLANIPLSSTQKVEDQKT